MELAISVKPVVMINCFTLLIVKLLFSYVGAPQLVIQMINASLLYKQEFHIQ